MAGRVAVAGDPCRSSDLTQTHNCAAVLCSFSTMRHFISFNYGGGKKVSGRAGLRGRAPASRPKPASRDEPLGALASRGEETGGPQYSPRGWVSREFVRAGACRGRSRSGAGGRAGSHVCCSSSVECIDPDQHSFGRSLAISCPTSPACATLADCQRHSSPPLRLIATTC